MKILVATAGDVPAKGNAEYIVCVAKRLGAEILVLHILRGEECEEEGQCAVQAIIDAAEPKKVAVSSRIASGDVGPTIIDIARREDVAFILMGASNGTVVEEWLSADVSSNSHIPVLILPVMATVK